jgi:hypothetical protein
MNWIKVHTAIVWSWICFCAADAWKWLGEGASNVAFVPLLVVHKAVTWPSRAWSWWCKFVWRTGFFIVIGSRYYKNWSHFYQYIYERQYAGTLINTYTGYPDLHATIQTCTWVADGTKELGDAFSSAEYIQHVINDGGDRKIGDCDEFAIYNASAILKSIAAGSWKDEAIKTCYLLTVRWRTREKPVSAEGHNVCLIALADGTYRYVDYFAPSPAYKTIHEVVLKVIDDYAGVDRADCIGWSVADLTMTPLEIHWE